MAEHDPIEVKAAGTNYEPIIPRIKDWPIAKLYQNKQGFIDTVVSETLNRVMTNATTEKLEAEIARVYYSEFQRMKNNPWKVDNPDEKDFWSSLKKDTNEIDADASEEEKLAKYREIIEIIIRRFAEEISGTFDPKAYNFAKRFLSFGFASLLNAFQAKNLKAIFDHKIFIQDRIKLVGEIDKLRNLAKKGTVILLPTHFSNLDSIILGWSIHACGLPAFTYGAGLNLYNSKLVGYFMNRLGAYKVDRRKKNTFYLETLKTFSTQSMVEGCHSLFFPGGTRSRSGAIEKQLKLGLLGTAFEAQRKNLEIAKETGEKPTKIFVVPLVMSYHFVLEAKSLVNQFLKSSEREKYYFQKKDEFSSKSTVVNFILQVLRKKSDIYLSFGNPMDLFGNEVNDEGDSVFEGRPIDISGYFESSGDVTKDSQRENVYTKELGEIVVERFLKNNIVLSSHLVAFTTFQMLMKKFGVKDFYSLKEIEKNLRVIKRSEILENLDKLLVQLNKQEAEGHLKCSPELKQSAEEVLKHGVKNVGIFHTQKPLDFNKEGNVISEDLELLYYYHNRMTGYDLKKHI